MNYRVEQLAKQALINSTVYGNTDAVYRPEGYLASVSQDFVQEYTNLIINECIKACGNHNDVEGFGVYPIRVVLITKACENNIREHFGIP
jgi:hypothetical protein